MRTKYTFTMNYWLLFSLFTALFLAVGNANAVPLESTVEFDGHRYFLLAPQTGMTWDEARAIAASETVDLGNGTVLRGHLVTINSQAEQDFVSSAFLTGNWQQLWLGGYQFSDGGMRADNWAWITGEEIGNIRTDWSYHFLDSEQPDHLPEEVLRMLINNGTGYPVGTGNDRWHDFPHLAEDPVGLLRYVIEFDEIGDNFVSFDAPPKIVSGSHWRSSDTFFPGWETVDFDDSGWNFARAPYPSPTAPTTLIPGTTAQHMWHDPSGALDGTNGPTQAFFRFTFNLNIPSDSLRLIGRVKIAVDDDYDFYVNGNIVFENHDGGFADVVDSVDFSSSLQNGKNVLAIHAVDGGWDNPRNRLYERVLFDANIEVEVPYFSNVTPDVGLNGVVGYRISIADVNNDGYPDLLLHTQANEGAGDVLDKQFLYLNIPGDDPNDPYSRSFTDYTEESGIRANRQGTDEGRHSSAAIFADVDNDGDLDMFSTVYVHTNFSLNKGTNELLLNDGNGHFRLAENSLFHNEPIYNTSSAVFVDYNNDSNIDLFIGNWYLNYALTQDKLYLGHGDGGFANVTNTAGISAASTCVYAVASADWNDDGYVDLFAPSYSHLVPGSIPIHWQNNGDGTFSQVQESTNYEQDRGYDSGKASFGTMPRDFDNDGDVDFLEIITHGYGDGADNVHSTVVVNQSGVFSWDFYRVTGRADDDPRIDHHGDHYGSWFDINNDGLADFVLTECGYENNRLYLFKQSEDNTFHLVTSEAGLGSINDSNLPVHNASPFDYDLDGDEDLLIGFASNDYGVQLWRNNVGTSTNWINITLEGAGTPGHSNRSAVGARVEVTAGSKIYTREVYAGNGHQGPQVPLALTFGLGQAAKVDTIKVYWPNENRSSEEIHNIAANRFIHIRELRGDLDENGCVDREDLNIILAYIRGRGTLDPFYDLNYDGKVNIADARTIVTLFTNPRGEPCH